MGTLDADTLTIDCLYTGDGDGDTLYALITTVALDTGDFAFGNGSVANEDHAIYCDVTPKAQLDYVSDFSVGGLNFVVEGEAERSTSSEGNLGDWGELVSECRCREEGKKEEKGEGLHGIGFFEWFVGYCTG